MGRAFRWCHSYLGRPSYLPRQKGPHRCIIIDGTSLVLGMQLRNHFPSLIAQTSRQRLCAVDVRLQPFGSTEATWLPLLHVARSPALLRHTLAALLSLDGSSVVRLLDALQIAGGLSNAARKRRLSAKTIGLTALGDRLSNKWRPCQARCDRPRWRV